MLKFTAQERAIKQSWSEIDNQLQRRHDLIPNLVESTKGFATEEALGLRQHRPGARQNVGATTPAQKIRAGNGKSSRSPAFSWSRTPVEVGPDVHTIDG